MTRLGVDMKYITAIWQILKSFDKSVCEKASYCKQNVSKINKEMKFCSVQSKVLSYRTLVIFSAGLAMVKQCLSKRTQNFIPSIICTSLFMQVQIGNLLIFVQLCQFIPVNAFTPRYNWIGTYLDKYLSTFLCACLLTFSSVLCINE